MKLSIEEETKGYKPVTVYELGINFNGYPLEDIHETLYDDIIETIPNAARERKNVKYKVLLLQEVTTIEDVEK